MDIFKRIAYLHQVQDLLNLQQNGKEKSEEINKKVHRQDKALIRLNSFYGHLIKEITMKHNIQILNCDPIKLFRCKRCFCQYDFDTILKNEHHLKLLKRRTRKKFIEIECPQCSYKRKVIFKEQNKTKFEKYVHQQQRQEKPANLGAENSSKV